MNINFKHRTKEQTSASGWHVQLRLNWGHQRVLVADKTISQNVWSFQWEEEFTWINFHLLTRSLDASTGDGRLFKRRERERAEGRGRGSDGAKSLETIFWLSHLSTERSSRHSNYNHKQQYLPFFYAQLWLNTVQHRHPVFHQLLGEGFRSSGLSANPKKNAIQWWDFKE